MEWGERGEAEGRRLFSPRNGEGETIRGGALARFFADAMEEKTSCKELKVRFKRGVSWARRFTFCGPWPSEKPEGGGGASLLRVPDMSSEGQVSILPYSQREGENYGVRRPQHTNVGSYEEGGGTPQSRGQELGGNECGGGRKA